MLAATVTAQASDIFLSNHKAVAEVVDSIQESKESESADENIQKSTKELVTEYFADTPILADVAKCESEFRQFDSNGNVLRGRVNASDVGVMQINEQYHGAAALRMGYDLYTLEGNMAYARYLYETQGTRPWNYSSKCWSKFREVAVVVE